MAERVDCKLSAKTASERGFEIGQQLPKLRAGVWQRLSPWLTL